MSVNKNNNSLGMIAGVAVVLIAVLFAGAYFGSNGKLFSVGVQTGTGATTQTATLTQSGGVCPVTPTSGFPKLAFAGTYVDPTNNSNVAQPAVSVQAFQVGNPKSLTGAINTVAGSGYAWSNGTATCGATIYAIFGDNTNYYYVQTQNFDVNSSTTYIVDSHLLKMANIQAPTYSNGITFGASSISYVNPGNGATITSATMKLAAGAGQYGVGAIAIDPTFNATEVTSIQVVGGIQTTQTVVPSSANVPSGFIQSPYLVPALSWYNSTTYSLTIKTSTLNANAVLNNPVNIFTNDQVGYLANGQLTPSFVNPTTRADLGQSYTSQNSVINIYS